MAASWRLVIQHRRLKAAVFPTKSGTSFYTTKRSYATDPPGAVASMLLSNPRHAWPIIVTASEYVSQNFKLITFALPGGQQQMSGIQSEGALQIQCWPRGSWFPVIRPYTPVHDLHPPGILQFLVKRYPNGRASGYLYSLDVGDDLRVCGPYPTYDWKPSSTVRVILLVAGGAGITPIYSLMKATLADKADLTRVLLVWGVNSVEDAVLKKELEEREGQSPKRLKSMYAVSDLKGNSRTRDTHKWKKGQITCADTGDNCVSWWEKQSG